ncbi:MAG: hypothetical protein RI958_669 [Actinomycetota bacterium]
MPDLVDDPAHHCSAVRGRTDLIARVATGICDGLALGERVACAGLGPVEHLMAELADVVGPSASRRLAMAHRDGRLVMLDDAAPSAAPPVPWDHLGSVAALAMATRTHGYAGLRVVRDATPLMTGRRSDRQRSVCFEHLLDRYCLLHPLTVSCCYDIDAVGADAVGEAAAVHRHADRGLTAFRLSFTSGSDLALFGSVDAFTCVSFSETLERIDLTPGRFLTLDLGHVDYIDHAALLALDEHGTRRGIVFELRRAPYAAERLARALELRHVRVPHPLSAPDRRAPWVDVL